MKADEQQFPEVLFIKVYKVAETFDAMVQLVKCDHSIEGFCCDAVYYAVQVGCTFESVYEILK